jgi:hypothetical protein
MADGEVIVHPSSKPVTRDATGKFLKGTRGGFGQPTTYTPEMGERIAQLVATSAKGLRWLCENTPGMPNYWTVVGWEDRYQDFAKLVAKARRQQALMLVDECIEIADDDSHDRFTVYAKGEPRQVPDLAGIARSKIRIDARIRVAKLFDPQRFGDRLDINARVGGFASQDDVIDELD